MLQIFSLALGLEETEMGDTFRYSLNDITMQCYPVQDAKEQSSISPHADYGGKFRMLLSLLAVTPINRVPGFTLLYQGQICFHIFLYIGKNTHNRLRSSGRFRSAKRKRDLGPHATKGEIPTS